jgi:epoxyqueuosine reductase
MKDLEKIAQSIKIFCRGLGFQQVGITDTDLSHYEQHFTKWLENGYHGDMDYMKRWGLDRLKPENVVPGTKRVIMVRLDYLPADARIAKTLANSKKAFISRYALGRDYHKVIRNKLKKLAKQIEQLYGEFGYRAFVDSGPVLERGLAEKAGLGWIGKNAMLINPKAGSWFFLGTLLTDLELPIDQPLGTTHCGSCSACIDICPTQAIVAPNVIDSRRCISYLTIEYKGSIPLEFRQAMGNRIYGCDDCQLICPWNKFARTTAEKDFQPRHGLANRDLVDLFSLSEEAFLTMTEGSAMRRVGYVCWLRNIAISLGNAKTSPEIMAALQTRLNHPSALVTEHVQWALTQHEL